MVETKKISQLSALEQITEQTCLLVEQEGKAYRLPVDVLREYLGTTTEPTGGEFTFTVYKFADPNDVHGTYTAVEGMTWAQFIESEYNTDGAFRVTSMQGMPDYVQIGDGRYNYDLLRTEDLISVSPDYVISPDIFYTYK